ncbi:MAG TPA: hypothetical protein VLM85_33545 [Polyangiaceae bacterium]|nr:hypothetical protein [Polyangiaceae bacterium]
MRRFCILACLAATGCGRFEGEIDIDETSGGSTTHNVYEAKGGHLRAGQTGKADYSIFESGGRTYAVNHADREVLVMDIKPARVSASNRVTKTAATETIAGHACTVWKVELEDGERGEVCVAEDLRVGGQRVDMWFPRVPEKGLPLRGFLQDREGKRVRELVVTSIQPKPIDSSRFELPKDYKRVDWDELSKSLRR